MKITDDVLAVLKAASTDDNALKLNGQLERGLYQRTNKVLEAAGGKWNRKAGAHVFTGDAGDALDQLVTTGEYRDSKQALQQFYTPAELADELVHIAAIRPGMTVLEPSAGPGALAHAARVAGASVTCIELDPKNAEALREADFATFERDFLTVSSAQFDAFDRVLMNPPFARRADIHHVRHATKFVKPGGRLVAIMSAGVEFRTDALAVAFRETVAAHRGAIRKLEAGAFRESGTMVNTVVVELFF